MNWEKIAREALERRAALVGELRALNEDTSKTDAEKREQSERINGEITAKEAEARDAVERGEREAEVRDLMGGNAKLFGAGASDAEYREGSPLGEGQSFAGYVEARSLAPSEHRGLNLGKYVKGMVTGEWQDADAERRAMAEGTMTAGGAMVPLPLAAQVIDLARAEAVVLRAGAQVVPMDSRTLDIAKWAGDPAGTWRAENTAVAESDGLLDKLTFTAQTHAVIVRFSRELAEDAPNLDAELRRALSERFALTLDKIALYGTGTAPEPRGVKNVSAVLKTPLAVNGAALTNYDPLIDSVGRVRDANETPNGLVYSPRTERALGKLKDSQNRYLDVPAYMDGITRISSNQIPNNLTVGTGTTCSDAFAGDWSQLLLGIRHNFTLEALTEKYADSGQIALLAWLRADVQVARPAAFDIVTGIL